MATDITLVETTDYDTGGRVFTPRRLLVERIKNRMVQKMVEAMDPVLDAQIAAAKGGIVLKTIKETKDGTFEELHEQAPSTNAAKFLTEFIMDKPKVVVEHTGAVGIVHLIKSLEEHDEQPTNEN